MVELQHIFCRKNKFNLSRARILCMLQTSPKGRGHDMRQAACGASWQGTGQPEKLPPSRELLSNAASVGMAAK